MKFELDEAERAKLDAWNKKHLEVAHKGEEPYCGAIGGRVSFMITSTSMGMLLSAECGVCVRNELKNRVLRAIFDTKSENDKEGEGGGARCHLTDLSDW